MTKPLNEQALRLINGYTNYGVSDTGEVFSFRSNVFLKQHKSKEGYMRVGLSKHGKSKLFLVHRLVAAAFVHNQQNKPQVNHIDNNRINNISSNLEWVTNKENNIHMMKQGRHHKTYCRTEKEYCRSGLHRMSEDNSAIYSNGNRQCKACKKKYRAEQRERNQVATKYRGDE